MTNDKLTTSYQKIPRTLFGPIYIFLNNISIIKKIYQKNSLMDKYEKKIVEESEKNKEKKTLNRVFDEKNSLQYPVPMYVYIHVYISLFVSNKENGL